MARDVTSIFTFPCTVKFGDYLGFHEELEIAFTKDTRELRVSENLSVPKQKYLVGYNPVASAGFLQCDANVLKAAFGGLSDGVNKVQYPKANLLSGVRYDNLATFIQQLEITPLYGVNGPTLIINDAEGEVVGPVRVRNSEIMKTEVQFTAICPDYTTEYWSWQIGGTGGAATYARQTALNVIQGYIYTNYSQSVYIVPEMPKRRFPAIQYPSFYIIPSGLISDEENPQISRMNVDIMIVHWNASDPYGQQASALINAYLTILTDKFKSMRENIEIAFNGKVTGSTPPQVINEGDHYLQYGVLHLELMIHEVRT